MEKSIERYVIPRRELLFLTSDNVQRVSAQKMRKKQKMKKRDRMENSTVF